METLTGVISLSPSKIEPTLPVSSSSIDSRLDIVSTTTSGEEESDIEEYDGDLVLDSFKSEQKEPSANFGSISVANSSDVHIGNKAFYNGPVTIKQIVMNNDTTKSDNLTNGNGTIINTTLQQQWSQQKNNKNDPGGQMKPSISTIFVQLIRRHQLAFILSCVFFILLIIILTVTLIIGKIFTTNSLLLPIDDGIVPYQSPKTDLSLPMIGDKELNVTLSGKLRLITRNNWLAQPPNDSINKLNVPVNMVIIHHTASANCSTHTECIGLVRNIQMFHIETRRWSDIAYNYLVGGDGLAYEGRGWDSVGAHTYGFNDRSIGIAFMGTFIKELPLDRQILACKQLIQWGIRIGKVKSDYSLLAARQLTSTVSPGQALFEELVKWPHWKETPPTPSS